MINALIRLQVSRPPPPPAVRRDGASAPRSPVREEGLGWAEAGWRQPGVVVLVRA
jgi:hypothetical protein